MQGIWTGARRALVAAFVAMVAACGGGTGEGPATGAESLLKVDATILAKLNGVWWNSAEPGTGFFFEVQGGTGVATFYLYEADGKPVWYTSAGQLIDQSGTYLYSAPLQRYSGGQPGTSVTPKAATSTVVGSVTMTFRGTEAEVKLPGRTFKAKRFYDANAKGPAQLQPETGIYWNPAESGRGYTIEVGNGVATVTAFHYTADGQPTWHLVAAPLTGDKALDASGDFVSYFGGQTLSGAYKAPTSSTPQGKFGLSFTWACKGKLAFPGLAPIDVQRFAFGGLPGDECRTYPLIPATVSPPIPATTVFRDVTLTMATFPFGGLTKSVGGTMPSSVSFNASGNFASLNGRVVYVIVVDPHGFYVPGNTNVTVRSSPPGASVSLTPKPLTQVGDYRGELQFYACLDPACATQFVGSPFKLSYSVFVR